MSAPTMDSTVLPRTTVATWHYRLVDLRTGLEAALAQVPMDSMALPELAGTRVLLELCAAELRRVNLALEIVAAGWDLQEGNKYAAACRAEGLLP